MISYRIGAGLLVSVNAYLYWVVGGFDIDFKFPLSIQICWKTLPK